MDETIKNGKICMSVARNKTKSIKFESPYQALVEAAFLFDGMIAIPIRSSAVRMLRYLSSNTEEGNVMVVALSGWRFVERSCTLLS